MRVRIHPEQQIQRINQLIKQLEDFKKETVEVMKKRPNESSWSAIEVIKHMSLGQDAYREKIETAFKNQGGKIGKVEALVTGQIPSFLIKRFPPKANKIRFKMKTMKQFKPLLNHDEINVDNLRNELMDCLIELKSWINSYRNKPISLKKFNSAIGFTVRFNIPEACEFILCHNERHFLQAQNTLKKAGKKNETA
jgi:hypothetical protein